MGFVKIRDCDNRFTVKQANILPQWLQIYVIKLTYPKKDYKTSMRIDKLVKGHKKLAEF